MMDVVWWVISVVFVGILINLVSDYFKPWVDKQLGKFSNSRKDKNIKREAQLEKTVQNLLANPNELLSLKLDITNYGIEIIESLGFSVLMAVFLNSNLSPAIFQIPLTILLILTLSIGAVYFRKKEKAQKILRTYKLRAWEKEIKSLDVNQLMDRFITNHPELNKPSENK